MSSRLSHVMVFAKDVARLAEFYGAVFGFSRRDTADAGFVELVQGDLVQVALHGLPADIASEITIASPAAWRGDTAQKVCFEVSDLATVRSAVLEHGGQAKEPWDWEGRSLCECCDPEGNVLQLVARAT